MAIEPATTIATWLTELLARLHTARKMLVEPERAKRLLIELQHHGLDTSQRKAAEAWILLGSWEKKGFDPSLELSDFFPDRKAIEVIHARCRPTWTIIEHTDLRQLRRIAQTTAHHQPHNTQTLAILREKINKWT